MKRGLHVRLEELSKEHQAQVRHQLAGGASNLEQGHAYAGQGQNQVDPMATPVRVRIHSKRKRLGDAVEGYCAKPCIDGIIRSGLLPDDSPLEIPQPAEQTHEKAEQEETIIIVEVIA